MDTIQNGCRVPRWPGQECVQCHLPWEAHDNRMVAGHLTIATGGGRVGYVFPTLQIPLGKVWRVSANGNPEGIYVDKTEFGSQCMVDSDVVDFITIPGRGLVDRSDELVQDLTGEGHLTSGATWGEGWIPDVWPVRVEFGPKGPSEELARNLSCMPGMEIVIAHRRLGVRKQPSHKSRAKRRGR